jgi:hypothetical protein
MAAAPAATKDKPKPAAAPNPASGAKPDLELKPAPRLEQLRGFGAWVQREILRNAAYRPDLSHEGFIRALADGIRFCGTKQWNTAGYMLEELEHQIRNSLRVVDGVWCDFVATDKATGQPRILCLTSWGFRESVEGQINFKLHTTERPAANGKGGNHG